MLNGSMLEFGSGIWIRFKRNGCKARRREREGKGDRRGSWRFGCGKGKERKDKGAKVQNQVGPPRYGTPEKGEPGDTKSWLCRGNADLFESLPHFHPIAAAWPRRKAAEAGTDLSLYLSLSPFGWIIFHGWFVLHKFKMNRKNFSVKKIYDKLFSITIKHALYFRMLYRSSLVSNALSEPISLEEPSHLRDPFHLQKGRVELAPFYILIDEVSGPT